MLNNLQLISTLPSIGHLSWYNTLFSLTTESKKAVFLELKQNILLIL